VTERERVIRLNGIGGVTFQNPDRNFDPGFLFVFVNDNALDTSISLKIHAHH